jgi:hypothetical protein
MEDLTEMGSQKESENQKGTSESEQNVNQIGKGT